LRWKNTTNTLRFKWEKFAILDVNYYMHLKGKELPVYLNEPMSLTGSQTGVESIEGDIENW
jgi:hypothetical protein